MSVFTGGGFVGAMFAGPIGDRLGRKWTILMGSVIFCLGGGLQTGAQGLGYLYSGRLLAGVGYAYKTLCFVYKESLTNHCYSVGFLVMIIPLYQAELCHPSIRGRVTTLQQFMLGIGALIASTTSWGMFFSFEPCDQHANND